MLHRHFPATRFYMRHGIEGGADLVSQLTSDSFIITHFNSPRGKSLRTVSGPLHGYPCRRRPRVSISLIWSQCAPPKLPSLIPFYRGHPIRRNIFFAGKQRQRRLGSRAGVLSWVAPDSVTPSGTFRGLSNPHPFKVGAPKPYFASFMNASSVMTTNGCLRSALMTATGVKSFCEAAWSSAS